MSTDVTRPRLKIRVFLEYEGVARRFFSLVVDKDNSFYIQLARPAGEPWRIPRTQTERREGFDHIHLDFTNYQEPAFEPAKVSFHQSGFLHIKNAQNERFRDGTRGPSFSAMRHPYEICCLVPCEPSRLPELPDLKGNTLRLVVPPSSGPLNAVLAVVRSDAMPSVEGPYPVPQQLAALHLPEYEYSLLLALRPVFDLKRGQLAPWPPFAFFLLRTAE